MQAKRRPAKKMDKRLESWALLLSQADNGPRQMKWSIGFGDSKKQSRERAEQIAEQSMVDGAFSFETMELVCMR